MKPMLAGRPEAEDIKNLRFPIYASAKLDGIRGIVCGETLLSRSLKPIPNKFVQDFFADANKNGLMDGFDGELIVGDRAAKDVYRVTNSAVMSESGNPDFSFYVFDNQKLHDQSFESRLAKLKEFFAMREAIFEKLPGVKSRLVLLNQRKINDHAELTDFEERTLALGYEGLILRNPLSHYKFGRATVKEGALLKLKRFTDGEATIVSCQELLHNDNEATTNELGRTARSAHKDNMRPGGTLGALEVKDLSTGVIFGIGTGFTASDREAMWKARRSLVGKIVKYKHFEIGVKDLPRFPVFLGFRDKIDL